VLEEGPRNDWFNDEAVLILTWVSALSAVVFFWRVLTAEEPIVDIRAFSNRNFALGSIFSFTVGIGLYGLTYLYPVYLGQIRGYNALMIGEALFVTGLTQFFTAPLAGKLMGKIDPRIMMVIGLFALALSSYMMTGLTRDWDFWELLVPQMLRGFGLMFAMIPVNNIALGALPPERLKNASGLFNLTRNLGGAVGLALLNTMLNDRTDLHTARLHENLTWARLPVTETLSNLTRNLSAYGADAQAMALKQLYQLTHRQGVVLAFADVFLVLALLYWALALAVFFIDRPAANAPPVDAH
jgi:MFS transporter, DHA2 family, multidrug resistance protein